MVLAYFVDSRSGVLVAIIANHTDHKLIQPVGSPLDAVNGAVSRVDESGRQHSAVTGRTYGVQVLLTVDWPLVGFQCSGEEVRKGCVLGEAAGRFIDFDAIDEAEKTKHGGSEADGHVDFADVASDAALNSGVADKVLQAVELFGQFVNPDNIYDLA